MEDLNDLYYFVQAVEHAGFAPAGRALGMPKSKLSRRVAKLESDLGVRLIQRSSRRFNVTDIGQVYFRHCKAMLVEAEAARAAIDAVHVEPCGTLRLSCPTALLQAHVRGMLADFMQQYPQLDVQLEASNRRVDVIGEGFDLAIRVRPPPLEDSDLMLRVLSDRGQCLVASPKLAEKFPLVHKPEDLANWPSLANGNASQLHAWTLQQGDAQAQRFEHQPRYITSDMGALHTAALKGIGVVQLPRLLVHQDLAQGRLQHLLPDWQSPREIIHVVFPSRRGLLPSVRKLIDHLVNAYAAFEED